MSRYTPYLLYKNILKFLEYRKLGLKAHLVKNKEVNGVLSESKFIELIQTDEYVILECEDTEQRRFPPFTHENSKKLKTVTYIVIVEPNSQISNVSNSFDRMLKNIPQLTSAKRNHNIDIIVVTKEPFKTNIEKKIEPLIMNGDEISGFLHIHNYQYRVFAMIVPEHKLVPSHRVLSKDESTQVLKETNTKKRDMPKIHHNDAMALWSNAVAGDIIEITISSEATGSEIVYRVCV